MCIHTYVHVRLSFSLSLSLYIYMLSHIPVTSFCLCIGNPRCFIGSHRCCIGSNWLCISLHWLHISLHQVFVHLAAVHIGLQNPQSLILSIGAYKCRYCSTCFVERSSCPPHGACTHVLADFHVTNLKTRYPSGGVFLVNISNLNQPITSK
jgi:hypothetical protein